MVLGEASCDRELEKVGGSVSETEGECDGVLDWEKVTSPEEVMVLEF